MKITLFIGGLSGGGAERVACNLVNYLKLNGHEIEILTMSDDEPTYPLSSDIKRHVLLRTNERKSFIQNSVLRLFRFLKYLYSSTPDVYLVMLPATTILLLLMRGISKSKVIASERSLPSVYDKRVQFILKKLSHRADGWVFQTEEQANWYNKAGLRDYKVIPNAINPDFIKPIYQGERRKDIVTVGSLTPPKNHELLITAFSKITEDFPLYRLVIYGKGSKLDSLKQLAQDLNVIDKVEFAGYSKNVNEVIRDASVFVLSSDYEGIPNALMEAMALGLPCISTDCDGGGARLLIDNEQNGLLVPKGDVNSLSNALKRLLSDNEFAESLGQNAYQIGERFAPEKIYSSWEEYLNRIVLK